MTTNPGQIIGNGQSYAVFLFSDAADTDQLSLLNFGGGTLFNNKTSAAGATVNLGSRTGVQTFTLSDLSTGASFSTGVLDSDGAYHATYSTNYLSFGVGALSASATAALALLPAGQTVTFVGFEDRRNADYDYNDLIFAFTTQAVPEPSSVLLLGLGLVGLGLVQMKRKQSG